MQFFIKNIDAIHAEAWLETFIHNDFRVVAEAKLILSHNQCLIDVLFVPPEVRGHGFGKRLVNELQVRFTDVRPIGVESQSKAFWDKLGLTDALGEELD